LDKAAERKASAFFAKGEFVGQDRCAVFESSTCTWQSELFEVCHAIFHHYSGNGFCGQICVFLDIFKIRPSFGCCC